MKSINEKLLEETLNYVKTYQIENGQSPTCRDIQKALGYSSLSMVSRYVDLLCKQGSLKKDRSGEIEIDDKITLSSTISAPIVGVVRCGLPIYAQENIEGNYRLPKEIFGNEKIFLLRAEGDSMIDAGINHGDLLVVAQSPVAENGQIVVALIEDGATVKRFYRKGDHVVLHPENSNYEDIICNDVQILGVVKHLIHKF